MPRNVVAFVPQHTSTKSRVMAIVDKGRGHEIDAVATVDWPHEAVALCNILNAQDEGYEQLSGLWHVLPQSVRASLEQARDQRVGEEDERYGLASVFITSLSVPTVPDPDANVRWADLFPAASCPAGGCEECTGCPDPATTRSEGAGPNQCGPGGACSCVTAELGENDEPCACAFWTVGPRWAAALHKSLAETAEVLIEHAEELMWGVGNPSVGFPKPFAAQPPQFFVRLAETCIELCGRLASGHQPVPRTLAESIMLDEAARSYLEAFVGKDGLEIEEIKKEWANLPEAFGDFELDALWMLQIAESEWTEIADCEEVFAPNSMDRIFGMFPDNKD